MELGHHVERILPRAALVLALGIAGCSAQGGGGAPEAPAPATGAATHAPQAGNGGDKACHINVVQTGDGYDVAAVVDGGSFPPGTKFTGHVRYRAGFKDHWGTYTPPDFKVGMDSSVHYASPITHDGKTMKLEYAKGVLDPGNNKIRTGCGSKAF